jgi:hypothetical protein
MGTDTKGDRATEDQQQSTKLESVQDDSKLLSGFPWPKVSNLKKGTQ